MKKVPCLSLFTGVGGLELGLSQPAWLVFSGFENYTEFFDFSLLPCLDFELSGFFVRFRFSLLFA